MEPCANCKQKTGLFSSVNYTVENGFVKRAFGKYQNHSGSTDTWTTGCSWKDMNMRITY